jgi:hypothetical protein
MLSLPVLRPTQTPIQWVPGAPSPGVKRPRCEADHSPATSAEVKNTWVYTSTLPYAFLAFHWLSTGTSLFTHTPTNTLFTVCINYNVFFNLYDNMTDPTSRQRGRPTWTGQKLSSKKNYLVNSPRRSSTPRQTD